MWIRSSEVDSGSSECRSLYDVSLWSPAGSIFGFLGSNGAGKTTLIHLMVDSESPRADAPA